MRSKRFATLALVALVALVAAVAAGGAHAKAKPAKPAADLGDPYDITAVRGKLAVYSDGKGHFIATPPDLGDDELRGLMFWSADGKSFYQQRVYGFGSSGPGSFDFTFWEPRVNDGWRRSFERKADAYTLQCDDRQTAFSPVAAADAKALLDAAAFFKPRWKHQAYALARDDSGRYFYVDRPREPPNSKGFRLYMGKKGELKPLKMLNVVSDSEGDIFATKSGELRLIIPKEAGDAERKEPVWIKGKKKTPLTWVPVENNLYLIYVELGVYAGLPLGTPCDDL